MGTENRISDAKSTLVISAFHVDPQRNQINRGPNTYTLELQIMDVLCELANKPRDVI